jgi:hypothetical protein
MRCNMWHTTFEMQHVAWNMQDETRDMQVMPYHATFDDNILLTSLFKYINLEGE